MPSLQVSLELRAAGEGLLNTELLQLCARVEGGRELFLPVQCREAEVPLASLESLGFQCEDRAWSFLQPDTRERLEVVSQEEAAAPLLRWLEAELRCTNRSGVLLVFLHRETLSCSSPGCRWRTRQGWGGVFAAGRRWKART